MPNDNHETLNRRLTSEATARFAIPLAAGHWPSKIGWGLLAFFLFNFNIGRSVVRDVVVPVFQELGACLAARIKSRLTPSKQRDHQGGPDAEAQDA